MAVEVDNGVAIEGVNPPDEGWWNAILADDGQLIEDVDSPASIEHHTYRNQSCDWDTLQIIYEEDSIINLTVIGHNRGGLLVQGKNVQGFVPISHLINAPCNGDESERNQFLTSFHGKELNLKIIEFEPSEDRVVFSERAAQAGEGKRRSLFANIKPNDIIVGTVTNVTDFGVFVDLGGLEGLIHVSELSWGRVDHPGDILCVGQRIETVVINVSEENSRIALSYKRLTKNPWEDIENIYHPGDLVSAKISGITKYGAFARLKEGVEGLIHISTIDFPEETSNLNEILRKDFCVQVRILHIDPEKKRIGLCLES